jgi:DHA1 family tetracycline resistance protein-like MFS transporter
MPHARRASLAVVFLTVFIDLLGFGMVLPLIPAYARELTVGYGRVQEGLTLGLLMTCYSIMQFVFAPFWGRVSDRVGRRPILILSLTGSACFYGLFGLATMWGSLKWMFISRTLGGVAGATIPTAQAYIADVTPKHERTRGMALIGVAFGLGFTFGPLLGAVALVVAGSKAHLSPWPGFTAAALSASALCLAVFKLAESIDPDRAAPPRAHLDLAALAESLAVPSIGMLLGVVFLSTFAFSAFEGALSLVLADFLGIEKGGYQILLAFAYVGFVQTLVQGGLVRWLANSTSEGTLGLIGAVLSAVGYLGLALSADPAHGGPVPLMIAASVVVSGLGFIYPSINSLLSRRTDPARQGGILGFGGGLNSLARISGMFAAMQLFEMAGHTVPFWSSMGLMLLCLGLIAVAIPAGSDWAEEAAPAEAD